MNIEFNSNEIIYCQQQPSENTITNFTEELFANPIEYKRHKFTYQNKEYNVLAETLLILIINQFKEKVDQKGIIDRFLFKTTNTNKEVLHRIKSSLVSIGIPNNYTPIKHKHKPREEFYIEEEFTIVDLLENINNINDLLLK